MNRTDFMAAAHKLAERLGNQLYDLVEKQTATAKARALEIAKGQLAAELEHVAEAAPARKRRQRRCSKCDRTGHTRRRCDSITPDLDETEDEGPAAARVASPPPATSGPTPIASPASKRPLRRAVVPPPGWTVEGDRREELLALYELNANRKAL